MNAGEIGGWIGAIVGGLGGLAGGIIGTYFSIKNTNGPRERTFVIKAAVICFVAVVVFLVVLFAVPNPYRWLVWIPYAILLPVGIKVWNKRQFAIRQEEAQNQPSEGIRR
jgi:Ca2+/Na+ antiporter